jgi:hypothetical protein
MRKEKLSRFHCLERFRFSSDGSGYKESELPLNTESPVSSI